MIPDFPYNIRIRLARLKKQMLLPFVALSLPCLGRDRATSGCNKKKIFRPILFLYYKESLISSNLNSKLLRFHCAHPNLHGSNLSTTPITAIAQSICTHYSCFENQGRFVPLKKIGHLAF